MREHRVALPVGHGAPAPRPVESHCGTTWIPKHLVWLTREARLQGHFVDKLIFLALGFLGFVPARSNYFT